MERTNLGETIEISLLPGEHNQLQNCRLVEEIN